MKVGAWKYAEHSTTDIICLAVKEDDKETKIWWPEWVYFLIPASLTLPFDLYKNKDIKNLIENADTIEAHNAEFERAIWHSLMCQPYNPDDFPIYYDSDIPFDDLPLEKVRCSAAKAATHALPRSLDNAIKALGLPIKKDMEGYSLMMKMCKPRNLTKKELVRLALGAGGDDIPVPLKNIEDGYAFFKENSFEGYYQTWDELGIATDFGPEPFLRWRQNSEDIIRLCQYCIQDVEAEYALSKHLRDLSFSEQKLWVLDQKINQRGIKVDIPTVKAIISNVEEEEEKLLRRTRQLAPDIISPRQIAVTLKWINRKIPEPLLENLQKATVEDTLKRADLPEDVRKILEIRLKLGRSSISKLTKLTETVCADGRARGLFMFHGANTGRWAGKAFQPQNLPRAGYKDFEEAIKILKRNPAAASLLYDNPMKMAVSLIRPMLIASEGHEFICGDWASIEGRVLAWLAGEKKILQNYEEGKCAYCVFASEIYKIPYKKIYDGWKNDMPEYKKMRFEGKTGELACGYQGAEGAIYRFAPDMEKERAVLIPLLWRKARAKTKELWYGLENVAIEAVRKKIRTSYNGIDYAVQNKYLCCRLPSGRILYYYDPVLTEKIIEGRKIPFLNDKDEVEYRETPDRKKTLLSYTRVNSLTKKWERAYTYGGKLTENCVQAIARDLLKEALFKMEENNFKIIFTAHDELMAETPERTRTLEEFLKIMCVVPPWAQGLPVDADGWVGKRYRK